MVPWKSQNAIINILQMGSREGLASLGTRTNMGYLLGIGKRMMNISWGAGVRIMTCPTKSVESVWAKPTLRLWKFMCRWESFQEVPALPCILSHHRWIWKEKQLWCPIYCFTSPPLSSLFLSPRRLPLLPLLRPSLLRFWRCAPPTHASTRSPKPLFFFLSHPVETEMNGRRKQSGIFFFACKNFEVIFLFFILLTIWPTLTVWRELTLEAVWWNIFEILSKWSRATYNVHQQC